MNHEIMKRKPRYTPITPLVAYRRVDDVFSELVASHNVINR